MPSFQSTLKDLACTDAAAGVMKSMLGHWERAPVDSPKHAGLGAALCQWCLSQDAVNALRCGMKILRRPNLAPHEREALARHMLRAVDPDGEGRDCRWQRHVLLSSAISLHDVGRDEFMQEFAAHFLGAGGRMATLLVGLRTVYDPQSFRYLAGIVGLTEATRADRLEAELLPSVLGHLLYRFLVRVERQNGSDEPLETMMAALTALIPAGSLQSCLMVRTWERAFHGEKDACRKLLVDLLRCHDRLPRNRELIASCMATLVRSGAGLEDVLTPLGLRRGDGSFSLWIDACGLQFQRAFQFDGIDAIRSWVPRQLASIVDMYGQTSALGNFIPGSHASMVRLLALFHEIETSAVMTDEGRELLAECARCWKPIEDLFD